MIQGIFPQVPNSLSPKSQLPRFLDREPSAYVSYFKLGAARGIRVFYLMLEVYAFDDPTQRIH
jgi:hypothetical protein